MVTSGGPSAAVSSKRLVVSSCLFLLLQVPASRGFLVPALSSSPPTLGAADIAIRPATAVSAEDEAEHVHGTTASLSGHDDGAGSDPSPPLVLTAFQEFVERRRSGAQKRVVLDLRPPEEFRRRHLRGSTSIPIDELAPRLLELPPPFGQPVIIVGSEEDRRTAGKFLTQKGWQIDARIGVDLVPVAGGSLTKAWPTEVGSKSLQVWRANEFLEFFMERFLVPSGFAHDTNTTDDDGVVLDLGCGSGRDTVYLAQHLPPGTRVIGVDNHSFALERGARLADQWLAGGGSDAVSDYRARPSRAADGTGLRAAKRKYCGGGRREGPPGVPRRACEWLVADLRKAGSLDGLRASVVHGHRFKCEQLLPLLRDDVLLPGGYFIWSTFMDTGVGNLVPPWRPSRMMRPGELAGIFSGDGFEILVDEQGELPTRGSVVPANFFACRKLRGVS
eukprot:g8890.t2